MKEGTPDRTELLDAAALPPRFDELISAWHEFGTESPAVGTEVNESGLVRIAEALLNINYELWHAEDEARRRDAPDSLIADVKRRIDALNQRRNDTIEAVDEALLAELHNRDVLPVPEAELSSETPGSIVDRLSILSLKIYHMAEQAERREAGEEHVRVCVEKLEVLRLQRNDLSGCLERLLKRIRRGEAILKVYRQFKMYNDPNLNPALYEGRSDSGER